MIWDVETLLAEGSSQELKWTCFQLGLSRFGVDVKENEQVVVKEKRMVIKYVKRRQFAQSQAWAIEHIHFT